MTQQDTLFINELTVPCIIGIYESERKIKQPVVISCELSVDTQKAGQTDDITDTVNYHDIAGDIYEAVGNSQFRLLEKLAQMIADICLKNNKVKRVTVRIEKPQALKQAHAKSAAIEIIREHE
jgi:D-erythro-7,8-dihydroneopterin triphosphate epimerase